MSYESYLRLRADISKVTAHEKIQHLYLMDLLSTLHFSLSFCTVIFKILDEVVNVNLLNGLKCDHSESFLNCVKNPKKYV
jgi:hypothetical protein